MNKIPLRAILFWDKHDKGDYYAEVAPERDPFDWRRYIPAGRRQLVADFLDSGEQILGFMGYADCRICGDTLGTRDMGTDPSKAKWAGLGVGLAGLVWPEMASHYVLKHNVWTPEHEELYARLSWRKVGF